MSANVVRKDVVDELRRLFQDGATPSQLMRYMANHHEDDGRLHFLIKDYFNLGFSREWANKHISDLIQYI